MNMDDKLLLPYRYDQLMESGKWREEIPYIQFNNSWLVKIIPPSTGAVVRFLVKLPGMSEGDRVSIYLDCYNKLGFSSGPYWEVYPYHGDVGRCSINDIPRLLEMIEDRIEQSDE